MFCETTVRTAPGDSDQAVLISLSVRNPTPLKVAVIERDQVSRLGNEWTDAGVYVLLHRPEPNGSWTGYVGKSAARGGIKNRLGLHARDKDKRDWYRAVAVCPTADGWDEAEITWLEGELYRSLFGSTGVTLLNNQEPGSGRLSEGRQMGLRGVDSAVRCVLILLGHSFNTASPDVNNETPGKARDKAVIGSTKPRKPRRAKLATLVDAGLLKTGTRLVPVDARWTEQGTVTSDGLIEVGGNLFTSPSSAGQAVKGGNSPNGWTFWAVDTPNGPTLDVLRTHHKSSTSPSSPPAKTTSAPSLSNTIEDNVAKGRDQDRDNEHDPPVDSCGDTGQLETDELATAKSHFGVGLGEIMAAGLLAPGTRLVSTVLKWPGSGTVSKDGRIKVGDNLYHSPSAAGQAVKGGNRPNGWTFWAVGTPDGDTLADLRERFLDQVD